MKYGSHKIDKLEYARFLAASLAYLAQLQRDAAGLIVFDDEVRQFRAAFDAPGPAARACCTRIEKAEAGERAPISRSRSRTCTIFCTGAAWWSLISDFWEHPENDDQDRRAAALSRQRSGAVSRARSGGDPAQAEASGAAGGSGNRRNAWKFRRITLRTNTSSKIDAHLEDMSIAQPRARAWIIS